MYFEADPGLYLRVARSASGRFIYVVARGSNMSEWHYVDADQPQRDPVLIEPRAVNFEYDVVDHDDRFLILHNGDGASDYQISAVAIAEPVRRNWRDLVPHQPARPLRNLLAFKDHLAVSYREDGLPQIKIIEFSSGREHVIGFPEEDYSLRMQAGREWDTPLLRFSYSSMATPPSVYDYDMNTRQRHLLKQTEIPGEFDAGKYQIKRLWAPTQDGVRVPVTVLHRKGLALDGAAPLYLSGYGAYGGAMDANFDASRFSLVDRGFVFAIAHLRGGMEPTRRARSPSTPRCRTRSRSAGSMPCWWSAGLAKTGVTCQNRKCAKRRNA